MTQEQTTNVTLAQKTNALALAKDVAQAAAELKAQNIKILDLEGLATFTDYFVVASGTSDRHVSSIADSIIQKMKKAGHMPIGVEGYEHAQWVIVDFGDVVVHVFYQMMRDVYAIEKFWADAKVIRFVEKKKGVKKAAVKKTAKKPAKAAAKTAAKKPAKKAVRKAAKKPAKKTSSKKKTAKKGKK